MSLKCKWCNRKTIFSHEFREFHDDYKSNSILRMCSGCRDAIVSCIKEKFLKGDGE